MFKKLFKKWREEKAKEQFETGFGWAATQLLLYGAEEEDMPGFDSDPDEFDKGIREAVKIIGELRSGPTVREIEEAKRVERDPDGTVHIFSAETTSFHIPKDILSGRLEEAPEWANWIAQDASGAWFAYEEEPRLLRHFHIWDSDEGKFFQLKSGAPNPDWKNTKRRIAAPVDALDREIENAPAWANWIAQDADGAWYVYEEEPPTSLYDAGVWPTVLGRSAGLYVGEPNPNWRNTKRKI